jgi:uncharacterized protein YoxC
MTIAATTSLFIFVGLFAFITVVFLGVVAFALSKLVKILDTVIGKIDPVLSKATDAIETVQRVTSNVGEKADQILTKGEALTDNVSDKVERTAEVVQKSVTGPLINLSSLISGVSKGFSVYSDSNNKSNNKHSK